ncbi:5-hydroxytryptamine receptor 1D-like isoform X2 [Biomphalaria glabrata]|nr:5-hydroxytryptamine receptor 1D-like isoform X2 [Biomphalaria glabrata]
MRTYKTSLFISSLAAADLMVCSLVMTINSILQLNVTRLSEDPKHKMLCHVWSSVTIVVCSSSSLNVCIISVDRYIYLTKTWVYEKYVTRYRLRLLLLSVWLVSFSLAAPSLLDLIWTHWTVLRWNEEDVKGTELCKLTPRPSYSITIAVLVIIFPCVTVIFINCLIFKIILSKVYLGDMSIIYRPRTESGSPYTTQRAQVHFNELRKIASSVDPCKFEEKTPSMETMHDPKDSDIDQMPSASFDTLPKDLKNVSATSVDMRRPPEPPSNTSSSPLKLSAFSARLLSPGEHSSYMKSLEGMLLSRKTWVTRISSRSVAYCEFKAGMSLIIIVLVYTICWLPFGIVTIIDIFNPSSKVSTAREICLWLAYSNSCWNPIIYSLMNINFRNALFKCLRSAIRRTKGIGHLCIKKKPIIHRRRQSDSHHTPTSFMLPLKSPHELSHSFNIKDTDSRQTHIIEMTEQTIPTTL